MTARAIKLVRTEINHRGGVAVISTINHDCLSPVRVCSRQTQRQFVCFAAAIDQVHNAQRVRQHRGQPLAVLDQMFMQITSVSVKDRHLFGAGSHDLRVTVADMSDVVDAIQIALAAGVEKILSRGGNYVQRRFIRHTE
jgi:hypothetical protein